MAASGLACDPSSQPPRPPTVTIPGDTTIVAIAPSSSSAPAPPDDRAGSAVIAWETSEPDARARSRRSGRPLLVFARASWDAASVTMERTTWNDPRVAAAARRFIALQLDFTQADDAAEMMAQRYGIETNVPSTLIVDPTGRRVAAIGGFADVEQVLALLRESPDP